MVLDNGELGQLSNHLGHSDNVHKTFYRQQESVIEKTRVLPLLKLVNDDKIANYYGKTLSEVSLEDIITAAHKEIEDLDDDFNDNIGVDEPSPSPSTSHVPPSTSNVSPSTSTANLSIENEVVSEASLSRSNQL